MFWLLTVFLVDETDLSVWPNVIVSHDIFLLHFVVLLHCLLISWIYILYERSSMLWNADVLGRREVRWNASVLLQYVLNFHFLPNEQVIILKLFSWSGMTYTLVCYLYFINFTYMHFQVKKEEKNVRRTVLNSVVGTLDLSIRQYLQGETYPGVLVILIYNFWPFYLMF